MDYQKIMCEYCKKCTKLNIQVKVQETTYKTCSDIVITKCTNFSPKYHFDKMSNDHNDVAHF